MGFLFFHILWYRYTPVPGLFPQPEVIRVHKIFHLFFDSFCLLGYIFFGKELFIFIIVDFIIANGADARLSAFFGSQQSSELLFLRQEEITYFLSRFS